MNTTPHTERPKLKLNLGAKPLTLATNSHTVVTSPSSKKVVGGAKTKSDDIASNIEAMSKVATDVAKVKNKDAQKNTKQAEDSSTKVVVSPEEILKDRLKRRKKEYFNILTKLQADFPKVFSEEVKPLAIGIHLELLKMLQGQFSRRQLGIFFHRYCGSFKYQEKLVEGAQRYNLDGSPATLVTKTEILSIINKPKFIKKAINSTDVSKTISNEIEPTQ